MTHPVVSAAYTQLIRDYARFDEELVATALDEAITSMIPDKPLYELDYRQGATDGFFREAVPSAVKKARSRLDKLEK